MPVKTQPLTREYVDNEDLAQALESWFSRQECSDASGRSLAGQAGVSPKALGKVMRRERRYQTVFLADKLLTAIGAHISELPTLWLSPRIANRAVSQR